MVEFIVIGFLLLFVIACVACGMALRISYLTDQMATLSQQKMDSCKKDLEELKAIHEDLKRKL